MDIINTGCEEVQYPVVLYMASSWDLLPLNPSTKLMITYQQSHGVSIL